MTCRFAPRRSLAVLAIAFAFGAVLNSAEAQVKVRGYYRKNGTYVQPHYRSNPDGKFSNNWSTKGNINPYTGKEGTRVTPPSNYGGPGLRFNIYSLGGFTEPTRAEDSYNSSLYGGKAQWSYYSPQGSEIWIENPHFNGSQTPSLPVANPVDARTREVEKFNYRGIGFEMTHEEFLHKFPTARPAAPVDAIGVTSYAIDDLDRNADAIWFQFFDNELYCIGFTYSNSRLRQNGGSLALLNRAKMQFGAPSRVEEKQTVWMFPVVDRTIAAGFDGSTWCTLITRPSVQAKIDRKKVGQVASD